MADNVTVSNAPSSYNSDIPVRTSETTAGKHLQHVRIDLGTGSSESQLEGTFPTKESPVQSAALSTVISSAASSLLLSANASRRGAVFVNLADKPCYVKFGTTASLTSFTYKLAAGATLEFPSPIYSGHVYGIWETSPTGTMYITEL